MRGHMKNPDFSTMLIDKSSLQREIDWMLGTLDRVITTQDSGV